MTLVALKRMKTDSRYPLDLDVDAEDYSSSVAPNSLFAHW
jgi:hypothetical protein